MSAPAKSTDSPVRSPTGPGAESPTTMRPLEMDDDDVQDAGIAATDAPAGSKPTNTEEAPPPKPPRPLSPQQQAENTLKEAFPSIDAAVVKAVLAASGGKVEPAFNALLGMSDPDAIREEIPPPQPPRPAQRVGSTPLSQLEADEQYARQLAEHYGGGEFRGGSRGPPRQPGRRQSEEDYSFIDDDLPIIRDNIKKGFLETQTKVNGWITQLKKKIDGDDEEGGPSSIQQGQYGSRRSGDGRRSGDYNRYDADPHVLGDDFAGIQLNDDGSAGRRSNRPQANPDLFKPTPTIPSSDGRKARFADGPPEDMDIYRTSPRLGAKETTTPTQVKQSKWQPLSAVDPSPMGEADNDPFSLGDSEDEKESKDRVGGKEIKQDDAERLKKAAAEAMADNIAEPARKPEPAETRGTKDKVAEELTSKS